MLAVLSYTQQKGENKCDKQANVHKFPDMKAINTYSTSSNTLRIIIAENGYSVNKHIVCTRKAISMQKKVGGNTYHAAYGCHKVVSRPLSPAGERGYHSVSEGFKACI